MRLDAFFEKNSFHSPVLSNRLFVLKDHISGGVGVEKEVFVVLCMYGVLKSGKFGPAAATDFRERGKRKLFSFLCEIEGLWSRNNFPSCQDGRTSHCSPLLLFSRVRIVNISCTLAGEEKKTCTQLNADSFSKFSKPCCKFPCSVKNGERRNFFFWSRCCHALSVNSSHPFSSSSPPANSAQFTVVRDSPNILARKFACESFRYDQQY